MMKLLKNGINSLMKILETPRLYLRSLQVSDLNSMAQMYSNIEVMRYIGAGKTFTKEQCEKSIAGWNEYETKHGFANWAIVLKDGDKFIGKCGFSYLPDNSDIEISYMLDEPHWEKGFASEISMAALDYGFDKLNLKRIVAMAYPENSVSIKIIEKMGMKLEKVAEYWGIKFLMYSIEKPEKY